MSHPELARPEDLNGQLISVLIPLRTAAGHGLKGATATQKTYAETTDPFLPARAQIAAGPDRTWVPTDAEPQFHSWSDAVLLASVELVADEGTELLFGRSAWTVAEGQPGDQPWRGAPTLSASLWWVGHAGLVLAMESVEESADLGRRADAIGMLLRKPSVDDRLGESAHGSAHDLLRELGFSDRQSLRELFGTGEVVDLADLVDLDCHVLDLAIPRSTVIAGHRLVEGLVVGLGSSPHADGLCIERDLLRDLSNFDIDDFNDNELWQEAGFRWGYEHVALAGEPAWKTQGDDHPMAHCAVRQDGRVLVADLNTFSIYHDYLSPLGTGSGVVAELIPLAAYLGDYAADEEFLTKALVEATSSEIDDEQLTVWSRGVSRVRWHLQQRRLQQGNLRNEPNFFAWTVDSAVRRAMTPRALFGEGAAESRLEVLAESVHALERSLERRVDERRRDRERHEDEMEQAREAKEQQRQSMIQLAVGVIGVLGLIGLFAALASLPEEGGRLQLVPAGLWTVIATSTIGLITALALRADRGSSRVDGRRYAVSLALMVLALGLAIVGVAVPGAAPWVWLSVAAAAMLAAPLHALWVSSDVTAEASGA